MDKYRQTVEAANWSTTLWKWIVGCWFLTMTSCNLHWDPNNVLFTKLAHWDGNFVRTEATASGFNFGILLAGNGCEVSLDCWANSCSNPGWWVTWLICDKLKGTSWGLSGKFLCHRWFAGRSECRNGQWLKYWQWITTLFGCGSGITSGRATGTSEDVPHFTF